MSLSQRLKIGFKEIVGGKKTSPHPSTPVEPPSALLQAAVSAPVPATQPVSAPPSKNPNPTTNTPLISLLSPSASDPPAVTTKSTKTKDTIVDNVALAVDVVADLSGFIESVPFLEPVARFLSRIITVYKKVKATDEKRDALLTRIMDITRDLHATVLRMETTGHVDLLTRLKSDLETYATSLAKASEFIVKYDQLGALHRGLARNQLEGELSTLQQDLDSFGARFRTNRLVDLAIQQNKSASILNKLDDTLTGI
ncbi:hypothetical protein B0H13DRAFT_2283603 [Mycena leptocephala]|nr:hypothetical protein B0H13DRAFT_2283603 [Mycena leptocephala]